MVSKKRNLKGIASDRKSNFAINQFLKFRDSTLPVVKKIDFAVLAKIREFAKCSSVYAKSFPLRYTPPSAA